MKTIRSSLLVGFLSVVGCGAPSRSFECQSWCGNDVANVQTLPVQATDSSSAQSACFDTYGATCASGALRKCSSCR